MLSLTIIDFFLLQNQQCPIRNLIPLLVFFICYFTNNVFCSRGVFRTNVKWKSFFLETLLDSIKTINIVIQTLLVHILNSCKENVIVWALTIVSACGPCYILSAAIDYRVSWYFYTRQFHSVEQVWVLIC